MQSRPSRSIRPARRACATRLAAIAAAALAAPLACAQAPKEAGAPLPAEQQERLAAMRAKGADLPLAVLPALVAGRASKEVGDAVGLILEQQAGLDGVLPATGSFEPPAGTRPDDVPALLAAHVRAHPPGTGHALLASFDVEQRKFVAVRAWIVDRDGALVWADVQQEGDAAFDRFDPSEPIECCAVVGERVRGLLGLEKPKGKRDGFMTRWWAAKSSLPPKEELDAMAPRVEALRKLGKAARVAVLPVRVAGEPDAAQADALAKALAERCDARAVEGAVAIERTQSSNEQLHLWTAAKAFRAHLAAHPADADYALLADYWVSADRTKVGAVHWILCTAKGEWVAVDWQNEHHDDFQRAAPHDLAGCDAIVARRLDRLMR